MTGPSTRLRAARMATDEALWDIQRDLELARDAFNSDRPTAALARLNRASIKLQGLLLSHTG